MSAKLALVCDDLETRVDEWCRSVSHGLGEGWEVKAVTSTNLSAMVDALGAREDASADGSAPNLSVKQREMLDLLDAAALVVFDSDLSPSPETAAKSGPAFRTTLRNQVGDTVTRQIRSYTKAGYLVVANMLLPKHPIPRIFDLTMMFAADSHADLHVASADLPDAGLWSGSASADGSRYAVWSWPRLAHVVGIVNDAMAAIPDVDEPALKALGLDWEKFQPEQLDIFMRAKASDTFRELAFSRMGFMYSDRSHDEEAVKRMAASVTRRWLNRMVLPAQNVISDAPHLITRFSPLLGDREGDIEAWRATVRKDWAILPQLAAAEPARATRLQPFLDRAVYDVDVARELLLSLLGSSENPPAVDFAEDVSAFLSEDEVEQFASSVPGPYLRRVVKELPGFAYEPVIRLL